MLTLANFFVLILKKKEIHLFSSFFVSLMLLRNKTNKSVSLCP
ncbi:hypothetical protein M2263_002431 [Providencia alcalifaciens]|nr:hypothetical protein [Providencia alcalifaciens]